MTPCRRLPELKRVVRKQSYTEKKRISPVPWIYRRSSDCEAVCSGYLGRIPDFDFWKATQPTQLPTKCPFCRELALRLSEIHLPPDVRWAIRRILLHSCSAGLAAAVHRPIQVGQRSLTFTQVSSRRQEPLHKQVRSDPLVQFGRISLDSSKDDPMVHLNVVVQQHEREVTVADREHQILCRTANRITSAVN